MLTRVGYLRLLLAFCRGDAPADAATCELGPYLKGILLLAERMTSTAGPDGTVIYRQEEDPRIEAAFATTLSEPVSATTRLGFGAEISRRMAPEEAATRSRGGQMLVAAIPFSPFAYRVVRAQFEEIVGAIDAVRDAVGRMAQSIQLRDENNAPRGGLAYLVGIGLPAVPAIIVSFLLDRSVAKGRPGALSKAAMIFLAVASAMVRGFAVERG